MMMQLTEVLANKQLEIGFEMDKYVQIHQINTSDKGCDAFTARISDGMDVFMTTWTFDLEQIRHKCPISCIQIGESCACNHNDAAILKMEFEKRAKYLIQNVDHTNLVRYIDVSCTESDGFLIIHLVQEFIDGAKSIRRLSKEGILPSLASIAEWVLKVISYLEKMNPKIWHGYINDGSIFLDKSGTYRISDFHLIPYLMYLSGYNQELDDLKALGSFIRNKNEESQFFTLDFIEKCVSNEKSSCIQLLDHDFLSNVHIEEARTVYNGPLLNQFEIVNVLGRGAYGSVVKVKQPANNDMYALKIIQIPIGSKGRYSKVKREAELISQINHKNVVKHFASWEQTIDLDEIDISFNEDESSSGSASSTTMSSNGARAAYSKFGDVIIIQMELCILNLREAIDEGRGQKKPIRLYWFKEILKGLAHLHEKDIIHRDLKPENILLNSSGHLKISDFGLATTVDLVTKQRSQLMPPNSSKKARSSQTGYVGTSAYVAPELNEKASLSDYGKEADIYSLGIIFFEITHPPFETGMERMKTLEAIRSHHISFPDSMKDSKDTSTEIGVIQKMLDHSPRRRPTADALLRRLLDEGVNVNLNDLIDKLDDLLRSSDLLCHNNERAFLQGSESFNASSSLSGVVSGSFSGDLSGSLSGYVSGSLSGDVSGSLSGYVSGNDNESEKSFSLTPAHPTGRSGLNVFDDPVEGTSITFRRHSRKSRRLSF